AGWVRHRPGMDDVAEHIDEIDRLVAGRERAEQREARERALAIVAAQLDAAPLDSEALDRRLGGGNRSFLRPCNRKSGHPRLQDSRRRYTGKLNQVAAGRLHHERRCIMINTVFATYVSNH